MRGVVTTVMHDTGDLAAACAFWCALLDLEVVFEDGTFAYLGQLGGEESPRLAFQQVPEPRLGKNRLHLDVRVPDRVAAEERIVELGGSKLGERQEGDFPVWSVMADPEGNEFCIYAEPAAA